MGFQETWQQRVGAAQDRAFGVSVTLTRGTGTTDSFTATWEDHRFDSRDEEGFTSSYRLRDFMFAAADVILNGEVIKPREGDRINITENGTAQVYEALPDFELPAVEQEPGGYRWRVHTKRVN